MARSRTGRSGSPDRSLGGRAPRRVVARRRRCTVAGAAIVAVVALVAGLLIGSVPASYAAAPAGFVHRSGKQLVDGQNRPIRLNGVNLGQWWLWEVREMGLGYSDTTEAQLMQRLTTLVGSAQATQFQNGVRDNYITLADFQAIAARGFNVVRVGFNHTLLEDDGAPGVFKADGWNRLDAMLGWAEQTGVYVVLDLHAAPCGQNSWAHSDPDPVWLWSNATCKTRTINLWKAIAQRYVGRTIVAGWDLLNEPFQVDDGTQLVSLQKDIATAIRSVDQNHLLIYEGAWGTSNLDMFKGRPDDNAAYSLHQYVWAGRDPVIDAQYAERTATRDDMPLWVGEFGQDKSPNIARQVDSFNADPNLSGWAVWTWKSAISSISDTFRGITMTPNWLKLIKHLDNPINPKPTAAEAAAGMNEYLTNMKLANTTVNPRFSEALAPRSSTIRSGLNARMCVDDIWSITWNGNSIVLFDCNATQGQVYSRSDGPTTALMTLGKCIGAQGNRSTNGTKVVLWDCDGSAGQQWTIGADGTIRTLGKCLDLPAGWVYNYASLQLHDCNGGTNQRWSLG